jgi:rubredoxin
MAPLAGAMAAGRLGGAAPLVRPAARPATLVRRASRCACGSALRQPHATPRASRAAPRPPNTRPLTSPPPPPQARPAAARRAAPAARRAAVSVSAAALQICIDCGYIYDDRKEAMPFAKQPASYKCPSCRVPKKRFQAWSGAGGGNDPKAMRARMEQLASGKAAAGGGGGGASPALLAVGAVVLLAVLYYGGNAALN